LEVDAAVTVTGVEAAARSEVTVAQAVARALAAAERREPGQQAKAIMDLPLAAVAVVEWGVLGLDLQAARAVFLP
jgi:hypothetical protein